MSNYIGKRNIHNVSLKLYFNNKLLMCFLLIKPVFFNYSLWKFMHLKYENFLMVVFTKFDFFIITLIIIFNFRLEFKYLYKFWSFDQLW